MDPGAYCIRCDNDMRGVLCARDPLGAPLLRCRLCMALDNIGIAVRSLDRQSELVRCILIWLEHLANLVVNVHRYVDEQVQISASPGDDDYNDDEQPPRQRQRQ